MNKRPRRITKLIIGLAMLGVTAIPIAAFFFSSETDPPLPWWMGFVVLMYAASAGASAVGLWQMRRWGLTALRVWYATLMLCFAVLVVLVPSEMILGGYFGAAAFFLFVFVAILLFREDKYLGASLYTAQQAVER